MRASASCESEGVSNSSSPNLSPASVARPTVVWRTPTLTPTKNSLRSPNESATGGRPDVRTTPAGKTSCSSRSTPSARSGLTTSVTVLRLTPSRRAISTRGMGCAASTSRRIMREAPTALVAVCA